MWYMFPVQYEESKINHLARSSTSCGFLWRVDYTEDFSIWACVLESYFERGTVYFEGPNRVWRALKTSILNTGPREAGIARNPSYGAKWRYRSDRCNWCSVPTYLWHHNRPPATTESSSFVHCLLSARRLKRPWWMNDKSERPSPTSCS